MLSLLISLILGTPAHCERVDIRARFDDSGRAISGELRCQHPQGDVALATYPAVLGEASGLDDVSRPWVYPDGFDAGWMTLTIRGRRIRATKPWLPPKTAVESPVAFYTRIPRRTSSLGHHQGTTYALSGWHPMPGDAQDQRIPETRIDYAISIPARFAAWVAGKLSPAGRRRVVRGTMIGRTPPVLLAPRLEIYRHRTAVFMIPRPRRHPRRASDPPWNLEPLENSRDHHVLTLLGRSLTQGYNAAKTAGLPTETPLTIIRAPLRERFTASFDGGFALSDRAFLLLDVDWLRAFHQLALWRTQLALYALELTRVRETEFPPRFVADAVASVLREAIGNESLGAKASADRLLDRFAVIPEIDSLVFAPQIPLTHALYKAVDEAPSARNHPEDFYHARPRGKIWVEKLDDRLGGRLLLKATKLYPKLNLPWLDVVASLSDGAKVRDWVKPFMGAYPEVDYILKGTSNNADTISVDVDRRGKKIEEVITVEVEDRDGDLHRAERVGPGTLEFSVAGPLRRVIVDPDQRLVETSMTHGKLARFNNRRPDRWRFLLDNLTGLVAVTNRQLALSGAFTLRKIYDLRRRYGFTISASPNAIGTGMSAAYRFGKMLTPLRLANSVTAGLSVSRLLAEQDTGRPGYQGRVSVSYGYDDRLNSIYSFEGKGFSLQSSGLIANLEGTEENFAFASASASVFGILPLGFHQGLLGRLRGDAIFGDAPSQSLLRLGGRNLGGRGYETTEVRGDTRVVASLEWRHALAVAQRLDFAGLLTWTRFEGAAFADAIYLPNARQDCSGDIFYDVGYGLRFAGDILSLSPAAFTIDFGVPLNRCSLEENRVPVSITIGFLQSFIPF